MFSLWTYILLGHNSVGKTTFQKKLVWYLSRAPRAKPEHLSLPSDMIHSVTHPRATRGFQRIFVAGRSYQEKAKKKYGSVKRYLRFGFKKADACILSSHIRDIEIPEIEEMIAEAKRRKYNVAGVFFSNSLSGTSKIARLNWNEVLVVNNRKAKNWDDQLASRASDFGNMLILRSHSR